MKSAWEGLYKPGERPMIMDVTEGKKRKKEPTQAQVARDWRDLVGWIASGQVPLDEETAPILKAVLKDEYRRNGMG